MKQKLSLIEVRFRSYFTRGDVGDWSGWTALYAFESKEDAINELYELRDEESEKFIKWLSEPVHHEMFLFHDYRLVDLNVY